MQPLAPTLPKLTASCLRGCKSFGRTGEGEVVARKRKAPSSALRAPRIKSGAGSSPQGEKGSRRARLRIADKCLVASGITPRAAAWEARSGGSRSTAGSGHARATRRGAWRWGRQMPATDRSHAGRRRQKMTVDLRRGRRMKKDLCCRRQRRGDGEAEECDEKVSRWMPDDRPYGLAPALHDALSVFQPFRCWKVFSGFGN